MIEAARALVLASAENARQRKPVAEASVSLNDDETPSQIEKKLTPGVVKVVNALRTNAALDREEIDVLWWSLSDWSETCGERFSGLAPEGAALVGGLELAGLLKRLPADAHRHLMLRHVANVAQKRDLASFLEKTGKARASVAAKYKGNAMMEQNSHVFPLLNAASGHDHKPTGAKASRTLDEWGARALLEGWAAASQHPPKLDFLKWLKAAKPPTAPSRSPAIACWRTTPKPVLSASRPTSTPVH